MDAAPSTALHRAQSQLNWSRSTGRPVDGDVISSTVDGQKVYSLRAQPRGARPALGVSFFTPSPNLSAPTHLYQAHEALGCRVTTPHTPLPGGMRLVNDGPLLLRLRGAEQPVEFGEHWTLYAAEDMPTTRFEQGYDQLGTACAPCNMAGQAGPASVCWEDEVDMDELPGDKQTRACTMALDDLAAASSDPNVRWFGSLFALHLRATDPEFSSVLRFGALANMAAAALEAWTVRDPFLFADACAAQDQLAHALECQLSAPTYKPFWDVQPFQFLAGQYSEALYDEEVKVCAPGFVHDNVLRERVRESAASLFRQLEASSDTARLGETDFTHQGITFQVKCGVPPDDATGLRGS